MRSFLPWAGWAVIAGIPGAMAAEPVFTHVHPAGVQSGTSVRLSFNGKFDPWPCQVHAGIPGLTFAPQEEPGIFEVTVDPAVPPGPVILRAFNAEGVSAPVTLVISDRPQTLETEPNDDSGSSRILTSGVGTINGQLDKADDVDHFRVPLEKGQTLVAWAEAHVIGAGVDAMLQVIDAGGITRAFNHDGPACMDPLLVFTAPEEGLWTLRIMGHNYPASSEIRFAGGKDCVYRLHYSTGPVIRHAWPLAAPAEGLMTAHGWNLPGGGRMIFPPEYPMLFPPPAGLPVEWTEELAPSVLDIPCSVSGRIDTPGGADRYAFHAAKGAVFDLTVAGPALGSEIDPWLKILDAQGKELAANDDAGGSSEARLSWTAPEDGTYTAVIDDPTRRGGPDYYYRFSLTAPVPAAGATIAAHAFKIASSQSVELKVKTTFEGGFSTPLSLQARGLPAGVSALPVDIPATGGETVLTLVADAGAPAASQPFQLVLAAKSGGAEFPVIHRLVSASENNGVPQGFRRLLIPETNSLWLTVAAAPPPDK